MHRLLLASAILLPFHLAEAAPATWNVWLTKAVQGPTCVVQAGDAVTAIAVCSSRVLARTTNANIAIQTAPTCHSTWRARRTSDGLTRWAFDKRFWFSTPTCP